MTATSAPGRSAFAVPAFRRLLAGATVSNIGDSALFLTLGIWAKDLTGSSSAAGLTFLFLALPVLLAPPLGHLADRVRRRRLLLAVNAGGAVGVLALLAVDSPDRLWILYAVAFGYGVVGHATSAAQSGLLKDMLDDDQLDTANGILMTVDQGLRVLGPLLGAGLYAATGGPALAVLASVTFGLAVLALLTVRVRESVPEPAPAGRFWAEVTAGARHLARTVALRRIVVAIAMAMLVVGFLDSVLFSVVEEGLGREPEFFGVLLSAQGAGSVVGGATSVWLLRRLGGQRLTGVGLLLVAGGTAMLLGSRAVSALVGMTLAGVAIPWTFVPASTIRQRLTPPRLQGRTAAAANLAMTVPQTVSIALGAALVAAVDYRWLVVAAVLVTLAAALPLLVRRAAPETAAN